MMMRLNMKFKFILLPTVLASLSILCSCGISDKTSQHESAEPIAPHIEFAAQIADSILTGIRTGEYITLTGEVASKDMVKGFTQRLQERAGYQFMSVFGEYIGVGSLEETRPYGERLTIYRFHGEFEGTMASEIRVVIDPEGKLAGFFVLPWKDEIE